MGTPMELDLRKTQGQYQTQFQPTECALQQEQPLNMDLFYGNQSLDEENLSDAAFRMDMEETPQE